MVKIKFGDYDTEVDQGWHQEFSNEGTINAKNLQQIVFTFQQGG